MNNMTKRTTWAKTHREAFDSLKRQIDFDIVRVAEKIGEDNTILFENLKQHNSTDLKLELLETLEKKWLCMS